MAENKKSLLQLLKDAIHSYQEQDTTEGEEEVLEDVREDVQELEEVATNQEEQPQEETTDEETETTEDNEVEDIQKEEEQQAYSVEEASELVSELDLSDKSAKEAADFIATLPKEVADKLVPLISGLLEETTVTSIQTLLKGTKNTPKVSAKKQRGSLGSEMAKLANQRKGK